MNLHIFDRKDVLWTVILLPPSSSCILALFHPEPPKALSVTRKRLESRSAALSDGHIRENSNDILIN